MGDLRCHQTRSRGIFFLFSAMLTTWTMLLASSRLEFPGVRFALRL
jgi:hypothetical protein